MLQITYILDKETKGAYRFAPDAEGAEQVGAASIYFSKPVCKELGITPARGFVMTIEAVKP